ncbi:MAG: alpha/beta hydrolase [Ignavibacteria bacterium]|jgi:alpha-beta hydrolase superfamily lysophospholipase|nr:alpha/beta hydrolase [Ignavibacteria bacterium]MCU7501838.1 alpha/beta hydrolase [Ignavibacteria bacterium]MCU7514816.1 alpha/beta hydrolase [Ignavibacteria bacterium]
MIHRELNWINEDGTGIYGQLWQPQDDVKGVVCLIHGLGEHCSRYTLLPRKLAEEGFALIAFDQYGHGRSEGKRGHAPSYEAMLENITRLIEQAAIHFPDKDIFLYGHSMGGNLVINYALRFKPRIKGLIATGPWLRLARPPKPFLVSAVKWLDKYWPSLRLWNGIKPSKLSHKKKGTLNNPGQKRQKDPFLHPWISIHTFLGVHEAGEYALKNASGLSLPILILHGGADQITSVDSSREFASKNPENCTLEIFPGLYHEIHNEEHAEEFFSAIINWLNLRLNPVERN